MKTIGQRWFNELVNWSNFNQLKNSYSEQYWWYIKQISKFMQWPWILRRTLRSWKIKGNIRWEYELDSYGIKLDTSSEQHQHQDCGNHFMMQEKKLITDLVRTKVKKASIKRLLEMKQVKVKSFNMIMIRNLIMF